MMTPNIKLISTTLSIWNALPMIDLDHSIFAFINKLKAYLFVGTLFEYFDKFQHCTSISSIF